jgi:hypothetical protein
VAHIQIRAVYRYDGDHDLGATVAAQMYQVCDRLPVPVFQAASVRCGFVDPGMAHKVA